VIEIITIGDHNVIGKDGIKHNGMSVGISFRIYILFRTTEVKF